MEKRPCVYFVVNRRNGTIYTGVTSDLPKRAYQHRTGQIPGFTKRYGCKTLVWYEVHQTMESAPMREKQLKAGSRDRKIELIEQLNARWHDLFDQIAR